MKIFHTLDKLFKINSPTIYYFGGIKMANHEKLNKKLKLYMDEYEQIYINGHEDTKAVIDKILWNINHQVHQFTIRKVSPTGVKVFKYVGFKSLLFEQLDLWDRKYIDLRFKHIVEEYVYNAVLNHTNSAKVMYAVVKSEAKLNITVDIKMYGKTKEFMHRYFTKVIEAEFSNLNIAVATEVSAESRLYNYCLLDRKEI